ncbi:unnamed protein product [Chrysodeixis includens]|uniref:Uncharacterized protein n=1 Tax=Chrysodeixis includens TaxID=689277 RepID=A0A9N8KZE1_CHRIL|nr:unnamed protein product [Chrysodeixis includens]
MKVYDWRRRDAAKLAATACTDSYAKPTQAGGAAARDAPTCGAGTGTVSHLPVLIITSYYINISNYCMHPLLGSYDCEAHCHPMRVRHRARCVMRITGCIALICTSLNTFNACADAACCCRAHGERRKPHNIA